MRTPLTALDAFQHDARLLLADPSVEDERAARWLAIARAAERLCTLPGRRRLAFAKALDDDLLPPASTRPTQLHEPVRPPASMIDLLAERLRVAAEAMERAGCYELAFTTVSAVCRLAADRHPMAQLMATAQLGRIARFLGDLDTATECYQHVAEVGMRTRDGPLASHGAVGLALVANMRGNRPAERDLYRRALALAHPGGAIAVSSHLGLMNVAIAGGQLADALLHGWQAYDLTTSDEVRAMLVSNMASTALRGGFPDAALRGFLHTLTLSEVTRVRVIAYGGAARAAAQVGDAERVDRIAHAAEAELLAVPVAYEECRYLLSMATAFTTLGEPGRARRYADEAVTRATRLGYHELAFQAEALRTGAAAGSVDVETTVDAGRDTPATDWAAAPEVATAIGRLEALRA
jgi:hypothetical protein